MVSLEDYAKDNPHKSRFSQMEDPKLEKLVDEAIAGIKKGIEPTKEYTENLLGEINNYYSNAAY